MLFIASNTQLTDSLKFHFDENVTNTEIDALIEGEKVCLDLNGKFSLVVRKNDLEQKNHLNLFATAIFVHFGYDDLIYGDSLILGYEETIEGFDPSVFVEL